jgi:hypothetical protein
MDIRRTTPEAGRLVRNWLEKEEGTNIKRAAGVGLTGWERKGARKKRKWWVKI